MVEVESRIPCREFPALYTRFYFCHWHLIYDAEFTVVFVVF